MTNVSDAFAVSMGTFLFKAGSYTPPATWYLGLASGVAVSTSGTIAGYYELQGGNYARQPITLGAIDSNGIVKNSAAINFPQASIDYGTVTGAILCTASSGSNTIVAYQAFGSTLDLQTNMRVVLPINYLRLWY